MTSVARILAVWLTPTVVLAVPAALAARGPDGLWLGLVVTLDPSSRWPGAPIDRCRVTARETTRRSSRS